MTRPKSYVYDQLGSKPRGNLYYLKYEADKAIDDLEESHKREVEQLLMEIVKLKKRKGMRRRAYCRGHQWACAGITPPQVQGLP